MLISSANEAGGFRAVKCCRIRLALEGEWAQWALTSTQLLISRKIDILPLSFFPLSRSQHKWSFLVKEHASVNIYTTLFLCSRALRALQLWSQWRYAESQLSLHHASTLLICVWSALPQSYFCELLFLFFFGLSWD